MKAEERHRLHENDLKRLTEHARERTRPFFEQYGTTLLLGLAAVLVVIAAVVWFVRRGDAGRGTGWAELGTVFRSGNPTAEDFANVAEIAKGSPAAVWARLYEGEAHLTSGVESLFTDKEGAERDLKDAVTAFEAVLAEKDVSSDLAVRSLYGLGRALEANSDGDLKPALDRYEQITKDYGDTVYAKLAQQRIDALKSADAKAFYAWFSKQKPAPADPLQRPNDPAAISGGVGAPADGPSLGGPAEAIGAPAGEAPPTAGAGGAPAETPPAAESGAAPAGEAAAPTETPAAEATTPPAGEAPPTGEGQPAPQ